VVPSRLTVRSLYNSSVTADRGASTIAAFENLLEMNGSLLEVAEQAAAIGTAQLEVDHSYLTRIVPEVDYWEVVASTAEKGPTVVGRQAEYHTTFCRHAVDADRTITLGDVSKSEYANDIAARRYNWACHASVPITLGDGLYGTLCFSDQTAKSGGWTNAEKSIINALGSILERDLALREYESPLETRNQLVNYPSLLPRRIRTSLLEVGAPPRNC